MNLVERVLVVVAAVALVAYVAIDLKSCGRFQIECDQGTYHCTKRLFGGEPIYKHSESCWLIWPDGWPKNKCKKITNPKCTKIER